MSNTSSFCLVVVGAEAAAAFARLVPGVALPMVKPGNLIPIMTALSVLSGSDTDSTPTVLVVASGSSDKLTLCNCASHHPLSVLLLV